MALKDLFYYLHLDFILLVGHVSPDRDVAGAFDMFCRAFGLSNMDARIILLFVKNGETYTEYGFFHAGLGRFLSYVDDEEESDGKSEISVARNTVKRSRVMIINLDTGCKFDPWTAEKFKAGQRVFHYDHHANLKTVTNEDAKRVVFVLNDNSLRTKRLSAVKNKMIESFKLFSFDRDKVFVEFVDDDGHFPEYDDQTLVICKGIGDEYIPYSTEEFQKGRRVFYYQPWSATGLVFRAHNDRLTKLPNFEHIQIMTDFIDAKDNGRPFDGRPHYEMNNLYGITNLMRGMNYRVTPGGSRDHAFYAESVQAAFYCIEAFFSVREMFGYNLNESQKGRYVNRYGISYFVGDFSQSRVNGQTARFFFSKPPYIEPNDLYPIGKKRVDFVVTGHKERNQLVIYNTGFQSVDLLDTAEIVARIRAHYPEIELEVYTDDRDFCLHVDSNVVDFDYLASVVEDLIEERRDTFINQMLSGKQELQTQIEEIIEMRNASQQGKAWREFYHSLTSDKQSLAMMIFFQMTSDRGSDEIPSIAVTE
ncbi:MAG: hypothetical protein WC663_01515 [Patescibacteria group bacterium]|jgi:hypothetical protein